MLVWGGSLRAEPPFRFPEERLHPSLWRPGCADWLESAPLYRPAIRIEKDKGQFFAAASFRVNPEPGESADELLASVEAVLSEGRAYPDWILPGINERPEGGEYFVTLRGMNIREPRPRVHFLLTSPYAFQVLWFRREGVSTLEMRRETTPEWPDCPGFRARRTLDRQALKLSYRMTPRPEILEAMLAEIRVVPQNPGVDVYLRLAAKPSRVVYELMSESLLRSQVELRGLGIFSNFVDYRRAQALKARTAQEAAKKAAPSKTTRDASGVPKALATPSRPGGRREKAP